MRIAIDASRTTLQRVTGTERYARELIRAIIRHNTQHDITLYFRDTPAPDLFPTSERVQHRVINFPRLWTHLGFAAALWRDRPDVTFVPAHTLPFFFPGRAIVTVHDLGFRYFPDAHPTKQRMYLDWTTDYSARRADVVLADSAATAFDLMTFYLIFQIRDEVLAESTGTDLDLSPVQRALQEKIRVVYPGVDIPAIGDVEAVRHKYNLPERYWLFVGTLQPRKNIERIVQAYARWRADHPDDNAGLVLAGGKGWLFDPAWVEGVEGVQLTGFVDEADKGALYAGALALLFPTLYEGFGFPVVEAMGCGTPVICSNTSSLPELAGDAALLVDPLDVSAISTAMTRLSTEPDLRDMLRERGYKQAANFTWDAAADQALAALAGQPSINQRSYMEIFAARLDPHREPVFKRGSPYEKVYVIDGSRFSTWDGFYDEVTDVLMPGPGPRSGWGRNLDAFNDILRGGFGTPDEGFVLVWKNANQSRAALGDKVFDDLVETIRANPHIELRLED